MSTSTAKSSSKMLKEATPYAALILQQFGYAGMNIISKFVINKGISQHVLVVYRHALAAMVIAPFAIVLERKTRPKMTSAIFAKIVLLGLLEPVMDQNLYYTGMKFTTATFATAMINVVPVFVFIMAWSLRLEKVSIRKPHSQAKILGTIVTFGGALLMAMVNGPVLNLPWTKQDSHQYHEAINATNDHISITGALMIMGACACWASFVILQAITLKTYPAELSLTSLTCLTGAIQGTFVALGIEWGKPSAWSLNSKYMILAALYGGTFRSGLGYYIQVLVIKLKGPVLVTAFNPVGLVIVAIMSSFILSEQMYLGRVIGAVVIIIGLNMVLWGKSKDKPYQAGPIEQVLAPTTYEHKTNENVSFNEATKAQNYLQELVSIEVKDHPKTNLSELGTKI
ncbi:WAT1-related protein At2g39510-like [Humulus lupulus]|uniref:WAT1-related protein At2g39510-like n=1 Tax=Humulus lupulus TaxID=3486 RepID=UPI002B410064|nr:WAT1-related protein At2g39510-like [Humulus lupulus]